MSVLIVAAHPDDEVLGCGATIAKLSRREDVHIAILGEGVTSRYEQRSQADQAELQKLRSAAQSAADLLGARSVRVEDLPDNRFDQLPMLDIVKRVEATVAELRPEVIYTHHPGDLNVDHALTFRAVLTATRPMPECQVRDIYSFEIASSTEWAFQQLQPSFKPNVFEDVSATFDLKLQAMRLYENEIRAFPHPRSEEALEAQARRWGAAVGRRYVEAFELVRAVHQ